MKFIRYEALKNWKSNNLADIIDVTDDIPEKIRSPKAAETDVDWLQFINFERYQYQQYGDSEELKHLTESLYLEIMHALAKQYQQKQVNLRKFMRSAGVYTFDNNTLFQALFHYVRDCIIQHYRPTYSLPSNYETYLLNQSFVGEDQQIIMDTIATYNNNLPKASEELQQLFGLTPHGTVKVWWDFDGEYRANHELTPVEENIMQSTTSRTTKPWTTEHKNDIVPLYLAYWSILLDSQFSEGPTNDVEVNRYFNRVQYHPLNQVTESKFYRLFTSLLKIAENTIRKKYKLRLIQVESDVEKLKRHLQKDVFAALMQKNQELLEVEDKQPAKLIQLDQQKLHHSQVDLTKVVDMITDFVGEDSTELELKQDEVVEVAEVQEPNDEDLPAMNDEVLFYQQFLRQLVEAGEMTVSQATYLCRERGLLLNAFINEVNEYVYEYVDDQVLVQDGERIVIDSFYTEDIQELIANNFQLDGDL